MVKVPIVAMLVAAGLMLPATARSQVSVNVNIGQPPPVVVARPVMVPVTNSPVYFSPSYGSDLFFYDGRYYTVRDDQWFYAARVNSPCRRRVRSANRPLRASSHSTSTLTRARMRPDSEKIGRNASTLPA